MKTLLYSCSDIADCRLKGDAITKAIIEERNEIDNMDIWVCPDKSKFPISIPAVQRGLVWSAEQVGKLWDSIVKDIPVGSMLACKRTFIEMGNKVEYIELLDGQQRCNAIRCGVSPSKEDKIRVWVSHDEEEENDELLFMVCCESHPWGYQKNFNSFSNSQKSDFNKRLKEKSFKQSNNDDNSLEGYFTIVPLCQGYPMCDLIGKKQKRMIFVPLPYALAEDTEKAWEKWNNKNKENTEEALFRHPEEIAQLYEEEVDIKGALIGIHDILMKKMYAEHDKEYSIPIHIISENKNSDYIRELFIRINKQGTILSDEDARYSEICVKMEIGFKNLIEKLSVGFMPPQRLANFAVRLFTKLGHNGGNLDAHIIEKPNYDDYVTAANADDFLPFCNNQLRQIISSTKKLFQNYSGASRVDQNVDKVPALIYLEKTDDNWLTVIACIIHKFKSLFEQKESEDWYHLLVLLPDIVCARSNMHKKFITEFWKGISPLLDNPETHAELKLLDILVLGTLNAAIEEGTFVYPYTYTTDNVNICYEGDVYSNLRFRDLLAQWWNWEDSNQKYSNRALIPYFHNNHILYYAQRSYLAYILKNIRPESKELWGESANKPFDIDHIIPREWWNGNPMMNILPNKQVYYYRSNRAKKDNCAGIDVHDEYVEESKYDFFCYPSQNVYKQCSFNKDKPDPNQKDIYEDVTIQRWHHIIKTVLSDLKFDKFILAIESLAHGSSHLASIASKSNHLRWAILRYKIFDYIRKQLAPMDLNWGAVLYRGKVYHAYNEFGMFEVDSDHDFYHSLTRDLSLGYEMQSCPKFNNMKVFKCVSIDVTKYSISIKRGYRRPFRVSSYIDNQEFSKWLTNNSNIWWLPVDVKSYELAEIVSENNEIISNGAIDDIIDFLRNSNS
ncbi:MAG: DUF262 domain-containing protein [Akkermansia sp.]|nr:DUF262 domain-containing protein [Akkermansia sp.]